MNFKKSSFAIQDKNIKDFYNANEYTTLADLIKDQCLSTNLADYWDKDCELNTSNKGCFLVYEN